MKVKKLVLPVAGLGKRLRPLTLTTPKNLIPLRGRPILEYALDEARAAKIEEVILIISPEHREKYEAYLQEAESKYPGLRFILREQAQPWGNGHAILQAEKDLQDELFAVRFCDDVIVHAEPTLPALLALGEEKEATTLLLQSIPRQDVERYGVVATEPTGQEFVYKLTDVVEKPKAEEAPSNLIIIGGYVMTPEVISELRRLAVNMRQENDGLMVTDAFKEMLRSGRPMYGWEFPGVRLDCGTLDGLKQAEEFIAGAQ